MDGGLWLSRPRHIPKEEVKQLSRLVEKKSRTSPTGIPSSKLWSHQPQTPWCCIHLDNYYYLLCNPTKKKKRDLFSTQCFFSDDWSKLLQTAHCVYSWLAIFHKLRDHTVWTILLSFQIFQHLDKTTSWIWSSSSWSTANVLVKLCINVPCCGWGWLSIVDRVLILAGIRSGKVKWRGEQWCRRAHLERDFLYPKMEYEKK